MIRLRNVRVNNLKNVSLDIPHGEWLAICGISGSGKSSLAFNTLYAESQRRFLDSISPSTRRFLTKLDKPDADLIDGLPPAIAVQSSSTVPDRITSVGNATEIVEFLRLLLSKLGQIQCPICETQVSQATTASISRELENVSVGTRMMIGFPIYPSNESSPSEQLVALRRNGFSRATFQNQTFSLSDHDDFLKLERLLTFASGSDDLKSGQPLDTSPLLIIVDRLTAGAIDPSRLHQSLETSFQYGEGECVILAAEKSSDEASLNSTEVEEPAFAGSVPRYHVDGISWQRLTFCKRLICPTCRRLFEPPEPKTLSYNRPEFACESCRGTGYADANFHFACQKCNGGRLVGDGLCLKLHRRSIAELCQMTINELHGWFTELTLLPGEMSVGKVLVERIQKRLTYLKSTGLGYLTLNRPMQTLSHGEEQRIRLTGCLSSTLTNVLYVLDEPSNGLHPSDLDSLTKAIAKLHENGNTVVVVDHKEALIRAAPRIIEVGPQAGTEGGEIVFDGSARELELARTVTGDFLGRRRGVSRNQEVAKPARGRLMLTGARGNNLKSVQVEFPLNCACVVTGVSGAGKSSLIRHTLYEALREMKQETGQEKNGLPFDELFGADRLDEVILVDQSPIGKSARGNPAIFVKAFEEIRQVFAETSDGTQQRVTPGFFSFNIAGGRCEKCLGDGNIHVDMQFLSDVTVVCEECRGTRYRDATLQIKYRGLNIAEVLNLTAREAFIFFRGQPKVQGKLKSLIDVGLDYIRLGQPTNKLSGGESQRLKLAHFLNTAKSKRTMFILEEPTNGLHPADVTRLLDCFDLLISNGHSLIVIEHNLQVIKNADWIIDLGPGAGNAGGKVVAVGSPFAIAANPDSITGKYLAAELNRHPSAELDDSPKPWR